MHLNVVHGSYCLLTERLLLCCYYLQAVNGSTDNGSGAAGNHSTAGVKRPPDNSPSSSTGHSTFANGE